MEEPVFSDRSMSVLREANRFAREFRQPQIAHEFVFFALYRNCVRMKAVLKLVGCYYRKSKRLASSACLPPTVMLPEEVELTRQCFLIFRYASDIASVMGSARVEPEHMMLGFCKFWELYDPGVAQKLGISLKYLRIETLRSLNERSASYEGSVSEPIIVQIHQLDREAASRT